MRAIDTIEQALAYPSERVRAVALQQIAELPPSPKTQSLLTLATRYAPNMSAANQKRVDYLCRCAEGSLGSDEEEEEEGTDWADAIGKSVEALLKGGSAVGVEALKAESARQQKELELKILQAKNATEAAALQRQAALQQQAAQAKIAAAQTAATQAAAKKKKAMTGSGHFQRHWGKYLAGAVATTLATILGVYLYKRQQAAKAA